MTEPAYTDKIGVTEIWARYDEALKLIGKQDAQGRTITIGYFVWSSLHMTPMILRLMGLCWILSLVIIQRPFAFVSPYGAFGFLHDLTFFSWGTWIFGLLIYLVYFAISLLQSSIYKGLPGAEIHFDRHKKIIRTLKPGEHALIFDFRVRPFAVVTTKPIAIEMPEVEGNTRDNISLTFRGALILQVSDTYKLLVEGGLEKFVEQLKRSYESILKDLMISVDAKDFNRFLIEEVANPHTRKENMSKKLEMLGNTDLTLDFLSELTEIDEVDVSTFDLHESQAPARRNVLEGLRQLASNYGIEILDHIPLGNTTSPDYLKSLALPLANSITRLEQSTDTLKEITEEEIAEEISANVADKEIGVLEIQKIIKEIESITATLRDPQNERAVVHAKTIGMQNTQQAILAPQLSAIEALIAQVQAKVIDTAGLERYMTELESLLDWVEAHKQQLTPELNHVVVSKMEPSAMLPTLDILENMLETTGTHKALNNLRQQAEQEHNYSEIEAEIQALETRAAGFDVEDSLRKIQQALQHISSDSGISTTAYSPESVSAKIDEIARKADLEGVAEV